MRLVDQVVYAVGYKSNPQDSWETSGKIFGNEFDAKWNAKQLSKYSGCITQVFASNRLKPITEEYEYKESYDDKRN